MPHATDTDFFHTSSRLYILSKPWSFKQLPLLHSDASNGILLAGMLQSIVAPSVMFLHLSFTMMLLSVASQLASA